MDGVLQGLELLVSTPLGLAAIAGVAWGILGGALPGISPSISMALLLPFTYGMEPSSAIVLLASTYLGAEYGGSIPAILIKTPGTNAAAATVLDGYAMNRQGRGGEALGISLYSGVIGGFVGLLMLVMLTRPLANLALAFTPMSYFALGVLGLSVIASLAGRSILKGLAAGLLGLMVATVGTDPVSGVPRFTFGRPELLDGIAPILVMVGLFAVSELFRQAGEPAWKRPSGAAARVRFPGSRLRRRLVKPQLIGTSIGTVEGVIPGAGGTIASFLSYNEARRWSRFKDEFGKGSPEGIAAPETANNTVASTALVPLLSFGIPGSNSAAILLGGPAHPRACARSTAVRRERRRGDRVVHRAVRREPVVAGARQPDPAGLSVARESLQGDAHGVHLRADLFRDLYDQFEPLRRRAGARGGRARMGHAPCGSAAAAGRAWGGTGFLGRVELSAFAGAFRR